MRVNPIYLRLWNAVEDRAYNQVCASVDSLIRRNIYSKIKVEVSSRVVGRLMIGASSTAVIRSIPTMRLDSQRHQLMELFDEVK
jgi:hypothetical protein